MYNDAEQEVGRIDFMDSEYNGTILSLPRIRLKNVVTSNGVSSDVHSIYINPSSILMDQVFRDGTYSVLLNPSGLDFLKDGVRNKKIFKRIRTMELNAIKSKGNWGEMAADLNANFAAVTAELEN